MAAIWLALMVWIVIPPNSRATEDSPSHQVIVEGNRITIFYE